MKKKKYLPLYKKWMATGYMTCSGLCNAFPENRRFELFLPLKETGYWGYNGSTMWAWCVTKEEYQDMHYEFTPLRQNIVLFLAAMNNEL